MSSTPDGRTESGDIPLLAFLSGAIPGACLGPFRRVRVHRGRTTDRLTGQSWRDQRRCPGGPAPCALALGYEIEAGKTASGKIRRPVLFGENGSARVAYEVDGFHPDLNIVLEIEAGRGAAGNADYRDLIRTSLIVDADFLILG